MKLSLFASIAINKIDKMNKASKRLMMSSMGKTLQITDDFLLLSEPISFKMALKK